MKLDVVNEIIEESDCYDVGGDIGCFIACTGGCLVTAMTAAPMAIATLDLT